MARTRQDRANVRVVELEKCPTGIRGLDEITLGGLPRGRPTLVCGGTGCGKTLLAMEFLVRGATQFQEPGVFMSFEETQDELVKNVASLGFDLDGLVSKGLLAMDHVRVERSEIEETGEYDLEGLFVRLGYAIDSVKAKRVVLDTIEALFSGLSNVMILRAELRRLFAWLKNKGITAIITGERGDGAGFTRQGIEEYVSDCVLMLDNRVVEQLTTRRLRVVKYRGSTHGTNEYPFLITEKGISVLPVTSLGLTHKVSRERISSGVETLDTMMGGQGFFRGSTVVVSGTPGTGKTSLAAHFASAACSHGEKCLYLAFEESPDQIQRNMESIGLDLQQHVKRGLLHFHASRPTLHGLELHLALAHQAVEDYEPTVVVLDPVTNLDVMGGRTELHSMLLRLLDYLKGKGITTLITTLTNAGSGLEQTEVNISSLIDTWILLRDIESNSERNRGMYVLKSRGMSHSNQIREYRLTHHGFEILDVYTGPGGALTGSARVAQDARDRAEEASRHQEFTRQQAQMQAERKALEAQMAALQARLVAQDLALQSLSQEEAHRTQQRDTDRNLLAQSRQANTRNPPAAGNGAKRRGVKQS